MRILQIAQSELGGGASKVAFDLHRYYRGAGHDARLLVKFPSMTFPGLMGIDAFSGTSFWAPLCALTDKIIGKFKYFRGQRLLREALWGIAWPPRLWDRWRGIEDFNYPYSHRLLADKEWIPDVIHLQNVSTNLFDLRALPFLSNQVPVVVTLHDAWFATGHCAYPMDCDRWRSGCGQCPDLKRKPSVTHDNTHANWSRKRDIYSQSRLFVAANSNWSLGLARESILKAAEFRVIHPGIDLEVFCLGGKERARDLLNLPQDAFICLYVSKSGPKKDAYKDYSTIVDAVERLETQGTSKDFVFLCVGGRLTKPLFPQRRSVSYIKDPQDLVHYYRAADVFLHAANAESFGLTLLEAQACGTPVIATEVGGIPETMKPGKTGLLVPHQGSDEMAKAISLMLSERQRRVIMGRAAASWVKDNFDMKRQAGDYLHWYQEILYSKAGAGG